MVDPQSSRAGPTERESDEESVEETPPPSPMPPKREEESTLVQQCPESALATEPEDNAALKLLESYGALRTPAFDVVTGRMSQEHFKHPYPPAIPTLSRHPQLIPPSTNPLASPSFRWVPHSPGIEATRLSRPWDRQPPPVSGPPAQPEPAQTKDKWYNEVKYLNTKEFSQTEATKHHSSLPVLGLTYPVFLGSPTDPKATMTWLPRDLSPPAPPAHLPCYTPSCSSRGVPSTIAGSSRPAWSVSSGPALPNLHTKGHRQEPYELWRRPGRAPRAPRSPYEPQPRVKETAQETAASAAEPEAGPEPAGPSLRDELPHLVKEAAAHSGPAVSAPKMRCKPSMSKGHLKGHRQEPYASSKKPRARRAPSGPEIHDDFPHRAEGEARDATTSVDETGDALPIRERKPGVDKGKATSRPETNRLPI
ncbi:unnamed protein product [Clonostachys rhizophaga]|uniref:Uncharacterized protein n=1 Tax=Clonostachys rhizophaga TaxID=160324 RepID=A0A9N9VBY3_9HYPO|nr:unnamed protein product [Clonostachys rhizophaga]